MATTLRNGMKDSGSPIADWWVEEEDAVPPAADAKQPPSAPVPEAPPVELPPARLEDMPDGQAVHLTAGELRRLIGHDGSGRQSFAELTASVTQLRHSIEAVAPALHPREVQALYSLLDVPYRLLCDQLDVNRKMSEVARSPRWS